MLFYAVILVPILRNFLDEKVKILVFQTFVLDSECDISVINVFTPLINAYFLSLQWVNETALSESFNFM